MSIQERILQLCKQRNWSLYKLAHESGISETTVYGWFNKNQFTPSRSSIEDICRAFDISVSAFFQRCGSGQSHFAAGGIVDSFRQSSRQQEIRCVGHRAFLC